MALTFANPGPLQLVGAALQARLALAFPPSLFTHALMPAKLTPQAWTELTRRVPFVGLGWGGLAPSPIMSRQFRGVSRWTVFLVTRNGAGELGRYFGDAQGPGLFQMVQAGVVMLQGTNIAGLGTASVGEASNAVAEGWEGGGAVIAAIDVEVPIDMSLADLITGGVDTDALRTTAVAWDFQPAINSLSDTTISGAS